MYKLFLQDSPNDCGPACLATILYTHGRYVTPIDLARDMELSRGGASNREVMRVAERHGLASRMIRLEPDQFDRIAEPVMAYTRQPGQDASHTVVIFKVRGKKLLIGDPGRGKRWDTIERFREIYLGRLILFRPGDQFRKGRISEPYTRKFYRFIGAWRGRIGQSLLLGLVASGVAFGAIYLSKFFVDDIIGQNKYSLVLGFAGVFLLARCLNAVLAGFNEIFAVHIKNLVQQALASNFFHHTLDLEKRHIDNRESGDFLQKFTQIDGLTQGVATYFSGFILVCFGMLVKMGILIWLYDPLLVALILGVVVLNTLLGFVFARATAEHTNRRGLVHTRINTMLLSSLEDIRVVRTFNARSWLADGYRGLLSEALLLLRRITSLKVYGNSLSQIFNAVAEAAIFLICGYRILAGTYSLGDFLVFLTFAQGLAVESTAFPGLIQNFQSYLRSFARLQAIQELELEKAGQARLAPGPLEVVFQNVSFAYNKENPVLRDISFKMVAGDTTAIVGESGSGKTTIVNLLMGFYKPDQGRILINGVDLAEMDLDDYRRRLAAVFQGTPIFNKNIYNNVSLGNPEITRELVQATAEQLGMDAFIQKMPGGYDYLIYPGVLSGGQTQRIGILRAMCKPFELLVMDEATSHLDSLTEERIVRGIGQISAGKSRLVIAHRLSTVMNADQILVIHEGRLMERGSHEELIARDGHYRALIERQYEVNLTPETGDANGPRPRTPV